MITILILHIVIALSSIAFTAYLYIRPSQAKLKVSYSLVALTALSGTYLIVNMSGNILGVCLFGLGFIALVLAGITFAKRKVALLEVK